MPAKLIIVIGPTAVGKSARAMELALQINGEIVSADSRHVYRGMDIGTNKPSPADQQRVAHHLINLREPHETFSLSEYLELARGAIAQIRDRDKTPILVGGTGQYIRAVIEGWQVPEVAPNEEIRRKWETLADRHGIQALNRELVQRDPQAATTIDPRNVRRVIRALEVMEVTGTKWSDLQRKSPLNDTDLQIENVALPRDELYARADARIAAMMDGGWLAEVRSLTVRLNSRGLDNSAIKTLPSMSALGYRELADVIAGTLTIDKATEQIKQDTRRYIRMQDAWFRPYWKT